MPDPAPDFRADLEAAKRASVAQLLFRCARQWNELAIQRIRVMTGQELLRPSHMALFPHIDLEGTRQVELARRLGISKQAVGIMIADLEAMGVVERVADPRDRRAKLICFSEAGRAGLMSGLGLLREMEAELASQIGAPEMEALGATLARLDAALVAAARAWGAEQHTSEDP